MKDILPPVCNDIRDLLDTEASRINRPEFIDNDPVQFPRRYSDLRDIEIAALLSAIIAWGNRKMICRDCEKIQNLMEHAPYKYVMEEGYEDLPDELNIHRTFFAHNMKHLLRGLREIYTRFDTLDNFSARIGAGKSEAPAWHLVEAINRITKEANGGVTDNRGLPQNLKTTALKRVNMALRWLVRDDGIVDLGVWKSIDKSQLYLPLDVHVGNTARDLGLITRKADDRKTVEMLTQQCRTLRPEDPCLYDYALFGIGIGC